MAGQAVGGPSLEASERRAGKAHIGLLHVWQRQRDVLGRAKYQFLDLSVPAGGSPLDVQEAFARTEMYMRLLYGFRPGGPVSGPGDFSHAFMEKSEAVTDHFHDLAGARAGPVAAQSHHGAPLAALPLPEHLLRLIDGEVCHSPIDAGTRRVVAGPGAHHLQTSFREPLTVSQVHRYTRRQLQLLEELIEEFPPLEPPESTANTVPR